MLGHSSSETNERNQSIFFAGDNACDNDLASFNETWFWNENNHKHFDEVFKTESDVYHCYSNNPQSVGVCTDMDKNSNVF